MPPLTVADAAIAIGGDLAGYDKALGQAERKTVSLGERLKAAFSPGKIIGAAVGAGFGIMLSGANQLDAATRQLQADTGMTADEAKRANHALAGLYRDNLQGFDEIGAAMAAVHNDLGLVGDDADRTTAKFLKFATATKQDAAGAVTAFDDILDAWNLTAEDAGGLMDGLIADHQKFGGVIAESQAALAAMAPAMQAANMSIDDGRALLNLFNAAGIDAAKAPAALARAVKELKPGQNLDDLIAQIASIEDPTLRGQEAMRIFGARGGIGMAQALKPGIDSLDDFAISADEAAGKTDEAADAIESGWGAKLQRLLKNVGGWLAEAGQSFGPLLMVAAAFGPKFTTAIASGLGGLASRIIPRIVAAIGLSAAPAAVAGEAVGVTASGGIAGGIAKAGGLVKAAIGVLFSPVGLAAAAGLAIGGAIGMAIEGPIVDAAKKDMAAKVGDAIAHAVTIEDLRHQRQVIQEGYDRINAGEGTLFGWDIFGGKDALQRQLDEVDAAIAAKTAEIPVTVAETVAAGAPAVEVAVEDLLATFGTSLAGVKAAAKVTGAEGMLAMAAGIHEARSKPLDAFNTLKEMLAHQMTKSAEIARLKGELHSKELARGMKSKDPEVRAQAEATRDLILERLKELQTPAKNAGGKAGEAYAKELAKKLLAILAKVKAQILAALAELGFVSSPTPKTSPAGQHGYQGGTPYIPYDQIAGVHRAEAVIPADRNPWNPEARHPIGIGAGTTVTVNVYNPKPEPASTSTKRELAKLAAFGVLG